MTITTQELDQLEVAHEDAKNREFIPYDYLKSLHNAFPALLAAAREQVKVIDERAEFEKWYMGGTVGEYDLSHVLKRYLNGMYLDQYIDYELQKQWIAWQARAKLAEGK